MSFVKRPKTSSSGKTVNPAGGVNPALEPNVSQYGWTSYDAAHVNQIIQYVNQCKGYADEAKDAATYIQGVYGETQEFIKYIEAVYEELKPLADGLTATYEDIVARHEDIKVKHADIVQKFRQIEIWHSETETYAEAAEASQEAALVSETNAKVSETGAEEWYDKSYELYEELRKGNIYRGTWNPHTGSYPDNGGTNSTWDVILNEGEPEYAWGGITWFWGDRLVYLKDADQYQQIESGTTVTSVNGKKGAVVLSATDVNALPITGGTLTGNLVTNGSVTINSSGGLVVRDGDYSARIVNTGGLVYIQGGKTDRSDPQAIALSGYFGLPLTDLRFIMATNTNPTVRWGSASHAIYHQGYKPTATDVNALPITGGELTGALKGTSLTNSSWIRSVGSDLVGIRITNSGGRGYLQSGHETDDANQNLTIAGHVNKGLTSLEIRMKENTNPTVRWGSTDYAIYHQGFKPTAQDVGAMSNTGDGVTTGNLRSNNPLNPLMELNSPGNHSSMLWVDHNNGNTNLARSNGAGIESKRLATWDTAGNLTNNGIISTNSGRIVSSGNYAQLELWNTVAAFAHMIWEGEDGALRISTSNGQGGANAHHMVLDRNGTMTIPFRLYTGNGDGCVHQNGMVSGSIWGGQISDWINSNYAPISDSKLKKNIKPATKSALEDVAKIDFVSYDWKDSGRKSTQLGVTAQQMEEIDPSYSKDIETFKENGSVDTSIKALDVTNCLALALKAIQELEARVKELEEKNVQ